MWHIRLNLESCVLALVVWLLATTSVAAQVVELTGQRGEIAISKHLRYWGSLETDPGVAFDTFRDGSFSADLAPVSYSAAYSPETWFAVELENTTLADGRPADPFILTLYAPAASGMRVYLVRENGLTEQILFYSAFRPFEPSNHVVTRLRSAEFGIEPGEKATLIGHVMLGPLPSFRASLFAPQDLGNAAFGWGVQLTAFYAFSLSCLIFFFGFQGAMRDWTGAGYAVLFVMFLALIAMTEGLGFRMIYPNKPEMQSPLGFGILYSISGFGFGLAAVTLRKSGQRWHLTAALAAVSLAGFAFSLASPSPVAAVLSYLLIGLMILVLLTVARRLREDTVAPNVGAVSVVSLALVGVVLVIVLSITGLGGPHLMAPLVMKVIFALMLIATMTALTANVIALRQRHLRAVEDRVSALEAEAQRSRELLQAERETIRARDLAEARQRRLAAASHDLRQPLSSLRMTFDTLSDGVSEEQRQRLDEAFDYLQSLSRGYVDETVPNEPDTESYVLSVPIQTVAQMFREEAESKGLELRFVPSSTSTATPAIPILRILSNLVSNAIKYTSSGGIVIGVRHGGGLRIVVADSGPGLTQQEIAQFSQPYSKGDSSEGHGLGLAVCFELAETMGLQLTVRSRPGCGTAFSLWLCDPQPQVSVE